MRAALLFLALCLAWEPASAQSTITRTQVGVATCVTAAASCTGTFTSAVAAGSTVEIDVAVGGLAQTYVFSITDSAGNSYLGAGSGTSNKTTLASVNNASIVMGYSLSTATALTTTSTFTVTAGTGTFPYAMAAFVITGAAKVGPAGAVVNGTWTSGTATTFATSPTLGYSSAYADAIIAAQGNPADTMGSYANGFSAVASVTSASSNRSMLFVSGQTITSGTATLVATPSSTAGRTYASVIVLWIPTGAIKLGCGGCGMLKGL